MGSISHQPVKNQTLADRLRSARRQSGLSVRALGIRVGVSGSAVAQWESPHGTRPSAGRLVKLASELQVTVDWLLTGVPSAQEPGITAVLLTDFAQCDQELRLLRAFRRLGLSRRTEILKHAESIASTKPMDVGVSHPLEQALSETVR